MEINKIWISNSILPLVPNISTCWLSGIRVDEKKEEVAWSNCNIAVANVLVLNSG